MIDDIMNFSNNNNMCVQFHEFFFSSKLYYIAIYQKFRENTHFITKVVVRCHFFPRNSDQTIKMASQEDPGPMHNNQNKESIIAMLHYCILG